MLGDPITDITIAAEVNYFQLNSTEYFVPATIKIPGRELALAQRGGAKRTIIDYDETGRIGTYLATFVIPNLNKEEQRIPISSVVLSSQRADLDDALCTAGKNKAPTVNPLIQAGQKLIPSVTRVFSKSRNLYVYLTHTGQAQARPSPCSP